MGSMALYPKLCMRCTQGDRCAAGARGGDAVPRLRAGGLPALALARTNPNVRLGATRRVPPDSPWCVLSGAQGKQSCLLPTAARAPEPQRLVRDWPRVWASLAPDKPKGNDCIAIAGSACYGNAMARSQPGPEASKPHDGERGCTAGKEETAARLKASSSPPCSRCQRPLLGS